MSEGWYGDFSDSPYGGRGESQEERFGSTGFSASKPYVPVKQELKFDAHAVKQIVALYVQENYHRLPDLNDIHISVGYNPAGDPREITGPYFNNITVEL